MPVLLFDGWKQRNDITRPEIKRDFGSRRGFRLSESFRQQQFFYQDHVSIKKNIKQIIQLFFISTFCKIGIIKESHLEVLFQYFPQWQKNIERIFIRQKNIMMSDLSYFENERKEKELSLICEDQEEKALSENLLEVSLI